MALSRHPNATGPRMSILAALDEADIDSHSQAVPNRRQTRRGYRRRVDQTMAPTTPGYTRAQRADSDTAWVVRCDARARTFDVVYPMVAEIAGMRPVEVQPAPFRRPTQTSLLGDQAGKPVEMDLVVLPTHAGPEYNSTAATQRLERGDRHAICSGSRSSASQPFRKRIVTTRMPWRPRRAFANTIDGTTNGQMPRRFNLHQSRSPPPRQDPQVFRGCHMNLSSSARTYQLALSPGCDHPRIACLQQSQGNQERHSPSD